MRTTIALDGASRDRLAELKRRWGCASLEEVVERLLEGPARSARSLYEENKRAVDAVLRRHRIRRLVAFGSRARGEARPDSDLDLAAAVPRSADLFDLVHIQDELGQAFGVPVDLVTLQGARGRVGRAIEKGVVLVA